MMVVTLGKRKNGTDRREKGKVAVYKKEGDWLIR